MAVSTAALPVATIARLCAALIGDRLLVRSHSSTLHTPHTTHHTARESLRTGDVAFEHASRSTVLKNKNTRR